MRCQLDIRHRWIHHKCRITLSFRRPPQRQENTDLNIHLVDAEIQHGFRSDTDRAGEIRSFDSKWEYGLYFAGSQAESGRRGGAACQEVILSCEGVD